MKPLQRVLIVDDDASAREWLAAFMSSRGLAPARRRLGRGGGRGAPAHEPRPGHARPRPARNGRARDACGRCARSRRGSPCSCSRGRATPRRSWSRSGSAPPTSCASPASRRSSTPRSTRRCSAARPSARARGSVSPTAGIEPPPLFAGQNRKMRVVDSMIDHVADTDITVLIRGESGTGKELVARTICARSRRARRAVREGELRRAAARAARERAVRLREGRVHRRAEAQARQVRDRQRRHDLPGRDLARCTRACRPSSCRCCRTASSRGSAATATSPSTRA